MLELPSNRNFDRGADVVTHVRRLGDHQYIQLIMWCVNALYRQFEELQKAAVWF